MPQRSLVYLPTGTELFRKSARKGLGALRVNNGTGRDSVVKLVEDLTPQRTRRAVYVRSGDTVTIKGIHPGRYVLRFALGEDWDRITRRFSLNQALFEFATPFAFQEVPDSDGVSYHTFSVTLHRVPGGNAPANPIDLELFEASDAEWR